MAIEAASNRGVPVVSGTSGLSQEDLDKIHKCGGKIPILLESNFSIGVQLMAMFIRKCAAVLPNYDCCLIDKHHNKKKDSPSGTAIFFSQQYQEIAQNQKTPQIASIRAGSICGDHICDFAGEDEVLTISHRAINREVFAKGAIHCARWILGKPPKATLYRMMDYLDDEKSKQKYGK
jgi:4-hydroxy-tetrahydrodipicolinate reductase